MNYKLYTLYKVYFILVLFFPAVHVITSTILQFMISFDMITAFASPDVRMLLFVLKKSSLANFEFGVYNGYLSFPQNNL